MTLFQIVNKRKYSLIIMELFELVLLHKNLWLFFIRVKFADFPVPQITHVHIQSVIQPGNLPAGKRQAWLGYV